MLRKWSLGLLVSAVSFSGLAPQTEACCFPKFKLCLPSCFTVTACTPCPPAPCPAPCPAPAPAPTPQACCVAWYDAGTRSWKTEPTIYTTPQAQTRVAQLQKSGFSATRVAQSQKSGFSAFSRY
jgi:hypothetical protein